jgi:hypothetical protein
VLLDRLPQDPVVVGECFAVAIAQLLEQAGGALDIREQEGDSAARELAR